MSEVSSLLPLCGSTPWFPSHQILNLMGDVNISPVRCVTMKMCTCAIFTPHGAGSHTALLSYVPTGRALSYITLLLLRAHTGRSQPLRAHTGRSQPLTLQGSAGLSAQSGGSGPAAITFFTTFITLTAYKSLKHYSRQVIPAAASYLREPRSGERHKGPVWLWNLGSCDRETG